MKKALKKVFVSVTFIVVLFSTLYLYSESLPDSKAYKVLEKAERITVVASKGDTIDGLAGEFFPSVQETYFRDVVLTLNGLESSDLKPGQRLVIPTQYKVIESNSIK